MRHESRESALSSVSRAPNVWTEMSRNKHAQSSTHGAPKKCHATRFGSKGIARSSLLRAQNVSKEASCYEVSHKFSTIRSTNYIVRPILGASQKSLNFVKTETLGLYPTLGQDHSALLSKCSITQVCHMRIGSTLPSGIHWFTVAGLILSMTKKQQYVNTISHVISWLGATVNQWFASCLCSMNGKRHYARLWSKNDQWILLDDFTKFSVS